MARIKIGLYVELVDYRDGEVEKAKRTLQAIQDAVDVAQRRPAIDMKAAVAEARALPASTRRVSRVTAMQREATVELLEANKGNVAATARELGITKRAVRYRMQMLREAQDNGHIQETEEA